MVVSRRGSEDHVRIAGTRTETGCVTHVAGICAVSADEFGGSEVGGMRCYCGGGVD
jgi:hypothetical protein